MEAEASLCIQDPAWNESRYLLEDVLIAASNASSGAAVFAFATAAGIHLLLNDDDFGRFLGSASFDLIVGMDAITDDEAINAIKGYQSRYPQLKARAFFLKDRLGIFHPKYCFFRKKLRGTCIVGSANLTAEGLRGNCEAYSLVCLTKTGVEAVENTWSIWTEFHVAHLLSLDHPDVVRQAKRNRASSTNLKNREYGVLTEGRRGRFYVAPPRSEANEVLLAEIPKSGKRWNQANFDLPTFSSFFGAQPGRIQRIVLTHVDVRGVLGPQEVRPSVSVKSHNYRFELNAGSHLPYPRNHRPIAVFVKVATRTFRYRLLMPNKPLYDSARAYLDAHAVHQGGKVLRLVTCVGAVNRSPFFKGLAK